MVDRIQGRLVPRSIATVNVEFTLENMGYQPRSRIYLGGHKPSDKPLDPFSGEQTGREDKAQSYPEPPQFDCSAKLGVMRPLVCSDDIHGLKIVMK